MINGCDCRGDRIYLWTTDGMGRFLPAVFVHLKRHELHGDWRDSLGTVAKYVGGP